VTGSPELVEAEVLFLGRRLRRDGVLTEAFILPRSDCSIEDLPRVSGFGAERGRRLIPGAIYRTRLVPGADGAIDSMVTKNLSFVRSSGLTQLTLEARALDEQVEAALRRKTAEKRAKGNDPIALEVERLAQLIAGAKGWDAQVALRAAVSAAIERRVYEINSKGGRK